MYYTLLILFDNDVKDVALVFVIHICSECVYTYIHMPRSDAASFKVPVPW